MNILAPDATARIRDAVWTVAESIGIPKPIADAQAAADAQRQSLEDARTALDAAEGNLTAAHDRDAEARDLTRAESRVAEARQNVERAEQRWLSAEKRARAAKHEADQERLAAVRLKIDSAMAARQNAAREADRAAALLRDAVKAFEATDEAIRQGMREHVIPGDAMHAIKSGFDIADAALRSVELLRNDHSVDRSIRVTVADLIAQGNDLLTAGRAL